MLPGFVYCSILYIWKREATSGLPLGWMVRHRFWIAGLLLNGETRPLTSMALRSLWN